MVDYTAGDVIEATRSVCPDGIDAIADMHGDAEQVVGLSQLLSSGGHVASAVGAADVDALAARLITGTNVQGLVSAARLDTLVGMLVSGDVITPEIRGFSLADAGEALAAVGGGHGRGKIVVHVP